MDVAFTIGRVIGVLLGILLFGWVLYKTDQKIRKNDNKSEKG